MRGSCARLREWGPRHSTMPSALANARARLAVVPPLVPLYLHRMLPSDPHVAGNPLLSVMQSEIIYSWTDLLDWFKREFHRSRGASWDMPRIERRLPSGVVP